MPPEDEAHYRVNKDADSEDLQCADGEMLSHSTDNLRCEPNSLKEGYSSRDSICLALVLDLLFRDSEQRRVTMNY